MKSWKTTVGGIVTACGLAMSASTNATVHIIGIAVAGLGALLTGTSARDNNVTSEQAGIK